MIKFFFNTALFKKGEMVFFKVPIIEPHFNDDRIYYVRRLINKFGVGPFEVIDVQKQDFEKPLHPQMISLETAGELVKISGAFLTKENPAK